MGKPTNRELLTRGDDIYARKRAKKNEPVEDVTFDREKRKDFLTGFHKRKQARIEKAREKARETEKEEKKEEKRMIKKERLESAQKDLERYQKHVSDLVEKEDGIVHEDSDEEEEEEKKEKPVLAKGDEDDFSDWEGLEDGKPKGVLKRRNTYSDDDGSTTTVTIETMDMDVGDDSNEKESISVAQDNAVDLSMNEKVLKSSLEKAELSAKHLAMMNSKRSIKKQALKLKKQRNRPKQVKKNAKSSNSNSSKKRR